MLHALFVDPGLPTVDVLLALVVLVDETLELMAGNASSPVAEVMDWIERVRSMETGLRLGPAAIGSRSRRGDSCTLSFEDRPDLGDEDGGNPADEDIEVESKSSRKTSS